MTTKMTTHMIIILMTNQENTDCKARLNLYGLSSGYLPVFVENFITWICLPSDLKEILPDSSPSLLSKKLKVRGSQFFDPGFDYVS
jgi:hypothetical protein